MTLPEPPDGTRIEFEHYTDVYAAWRDDESSRQAGWPIGDGGRVWVVYPGSVPQTWAKLVEDFGEESLSLAVRLVDHPDDAGKRALWPTSIYHQKPLPRSDLAVPRPARGDRPRPRPAAAGSGVTA